MYTVDAISETDLFLTIEAYTFDTDGLEAVLEALELLHVKEEERDVAYVIFDDDGVAVAELDGKERTIFRRAP